MTTKRDHKIDNIKGILILLVVFGHAIEYFVFKNTKSIAFVYLAIYIFHMPAFIFVSGYLSKRHSTSKIIQLFSVYTLWQLILYPLIMSILLGCSFEKELNPLFLPEKTYWYLLSLIFWKVLTPYAKTIKFIMPISIFLGVFVGFNTLSDELIAFSFSRTIVFYPFFLAGYYCTNKHIEKIKSSIPKLVGLLLFALIIILSLVFFEYITRFSPKPTYITKHLFAKDSYSEFLYNPLIGCGIRILLYAIQFICITLIFSFASGNQSFFSRIGTSSFPIYLTHILIIIFFEKRVFPAYVDMPAPTILASAFLASIAYCYLLTTSISKKIFKPLTSCSLKLIETTNSKE